MNELRLNQKYAIETSINNNFQSGVHFHATGTGKSWIAMNLVDNYNNIYKDHNILWICEKKSILIEQFEKSNLKKRNFNNIYKNFNVLNFSENKSNTWFNSVNTAKFWGKPLLLIINRAFLSYNNNYSKIKLPFHLIIHDECHTINKSTKEFYEYITNTNLNIKCIGFSATPNLEFKPFDNILSSYSIYNAFLDKVIVPPKIKWLSYDSVLDYDEIVCVIKNIINSENLFYKKIIIWCGMIELSVQMANLWSIYFEDYLICIDTSKDTEEFNNYKKFYDAENKAILFCANKHREGSDIKNLDCCIFLDKVQNRCSKLFVQCIGRVLRYDTNKQKQYGLVIDVKAKNSYTLCNNINSYLQLEEHIYPWNYNYEMITHNEKLIKINTLDMVEDKNDKNIDCELNDNFNNIDVEYLKKMFIRKLPDEEKYINQLNYELELLSSKKLICYLIQTLEILNMTKNIPHVTRGSCGSSLVCYLLGITHIDPIKNNIKFARFLNEYRNNLPDIDLDFPHNLRDEVFIKIQLRWPGKIARISNHVYYHEKSALRQAFRNAGIRKFIGKNDINNELKSLSKDQQKIILKQKENLENTFRCYSLHCGGIVYFSEGIPKNLLMKESKTKKIGVMHQIIMNKEEIAKEKNFKIDILSSRALSQCYEINKHKLISFDEFHYDEKTFEMLGKGDNIGITLAESPLIRKAFMKIKPKCIYDLALCLSIIRPAAKDAKNYNNIDELNNKIVFDDDAIDIIAKDFNLSYAEADKYRRGFAKGSKKVIDEFRKLISHLSKIEQKEIMKKFSNLSRYGFCKAHAFSYAQLIWQLSYMKANYPEDFWRATLNNCDSSYRKWVHYYEAKLAGVNILENQIKRNDVSIYALNRRKKLESLTVEKQLQKYGYWNMINDNFFPNCYLLIEGDEYIFRGIIASHRLINTFSKNNKTLMLFIGVEKKKYIHVNIQNIKYFNNKFIGIKGRGRPISDLDKKCDVIEAEKYEFY
jgi:superfamily II DNA or RNA helicase/mRNA-degrading endonuclease RelE of RelBE toxin-antitoxin system